jgi:hypothetical protein
MLQHILLLTLCLGPMVTAYFSMCSYAPAQPILHHKVINVHDKRFVIGELVPSTYCGLDDADKCPDGSKTLIDDEMTYLAVAYH